jgi:pilus assembly protein CpaE
MISFLGCKGGVGATFAAINAACALAQKGELLLVDLDLRYGQMNHFFNAQPQHTIAELIQNLETLDPNYLQSTFYVHAENLYLLPAPATIEESEKMTPDQMEQILRYLKKNLGYPWILLDCGHDLDEFNIRALELSDELVLLANASIPALGNARKILGLLKLLNYQNLKISLWINSWEQNGDLRLEEIENFLGEKIAGTLPFARKEVEQSIAEGRPLLEMVSRGPMADALKKLASDIGGSDQSGATQNSRVGWFTRRWRRG